MFRDLKNLILRPSNKVIQFIVINALIFICIKLIAVVEFLFQSSSGFSAIIVHYLSVPASVQNFLYQPWSLISYMFLHEEFFHILFNMLWLFWFGNIFVEYLGNKKFPFLYFASGISGALLFILFYNIFPVFSSSIANSYALGASASVMGIVVATATLLPDYSLHLILLGPVRLKFIAVFYVLLDLISIGNINSGGHIAHLGGALFGFIFIKQLRSGNDWQKRFTDLFTSSKKMKVSHFNPEKNKKDEFQQEQIDAILDKIAKSGYDSLSKKEKETLFKASEKK